MPLVSPSRVLGSVPTVVVNLIMFIIRHAEVQMTVAYNFGFFNLKLIGKLGSLLLGDGCMVPRKLMGSGR